MTSPVASAVTAALPPDSGIRVGTVTAIESVSAITVNVGGGIITGMPFLASYIPAVGDTVQIIRMDATWLCVGEIGSPRGTMVGGARGTTVTTVVTSSTTEFDIPFLSFVADLKLSHVYEMLVRLIVTQSVATDVFEIRLRRDTALTGTEIGFWRFTIGVTTGSMSQIMVSPFEANASETVNIFVSVLQVAGTGTLTVTSRAAGGNAQLASYSRMIDMGLDQAVSGSNWGHP